MQKRKGFTTVELVIVIAVIAILATALIPTFGGLIKSANLTTDKQTANALTTLTTMYAMEHGINSERDLADAINEGMGDGYYQNLMAKSAQYGYCFWYDYDSYRVHLGTVEEITNLPRTYSPNGVRLGSAGSSSNSFAPGLRTDLVDGFFLMGSKGGNELLDLVINLENASLETYQSAYEAVANFNSDDTFLNDAVTQLKTNLSTTLIHNDFARIVPSDIPEGTNLVVHIPLNAQVLNRTTTMTYKNGAVTTSDATIPADFVATVYIPNGTTLPTGALDYLQPGSTVDVNASYDDMRALIDLGAIKENVNVSTNDGSIYKQDHTENKWVDANGVKLDNCNVFDILASFAVSIPTGDGYILPGKNGNPSTIYVSKDLTNFSLTANSFMQADGTTFPESGLSLIQWAVNGASVQSSSDVSCSIPHANGSAIAVEINGVKYFYTVKTFDAETFAVYRLGGAQGNFYLDYTPGVDQSWTIEPQFGCTDSLLVDMVHLNTTISIVSDSSSRFDDMFSIVTENGKQKLQFNGALNNLISGNQEGSLTLKCRGMTDTISIVLVDESKAAFSIADNANTRKEYGFTFTVGTVNEIPLKYLFNAPDTSKGDVIIKSNRSGVLKTITAADNYDNLSLNLAGAFTDGGTEMTLDLTIQYKDDASSARTLALRVINGAHNVDSPKEWIDAGNNNSIAVLNSFHIDTKKTKIEQQWSWDSWSYVDVEVFDSSASTTTAQSYVKDLGNASLYGNFQTINVSFFEIYIASYNWFITTNGGTLEQVILIGPDYGSKVSVTGSSKVPVIGTEIGDAYTKGTHIAAIYASSVNIRDSFISGFRCPLTVSTAGGTVNVENTTFHRGNFCNINIEGSSTLNLNNVTTIQYEGKDNNLGAGIFYKYNVGTHTINATNLTMHNYVTKAQINGIVKQFMSLAGALPGDFLGDAEFAAMEHIKHNDSESAEPLYHTGIFVLGRNEVLPNVTITGVNWGSYEATNEVAKEALGDNYRVTISGAMKADACGDACSHTRPAISGTYTIETYRDYLIEQFKNAR